jgi:guanyl-specific ribonuclease Sa
VPSRRPLWRAQQQKWPRERGRRRGSTRFVSTAEGVVHDLKPTLDRIASGGKFPHRNDGSIFKSLEGLLPKQNAGYYNEFVHPTLGGKGPGAMRIVTGQGGEMWFTPDHYKTFIPIR